MISCISGVLLEKTQKELTIDVNGIGYEILVPLSTFYQLPNINEKVQLYTHLVVREDALTLYGFYSIAERTLFRALIKVNGVGPKLAITILSNVNLDDFIQNIQSNNINQLSSIKGLGPKTAKRLVVEMRDILLKTDFAVQFNAKASSDANAPMTNAIMQDALSGLIGLGYKAHHAKQTLQMVYQPGMNSEALIRLALQQMA